MTSEVLSSTRYAQIPQLYDILQISAKASSKACRVVKMKNPYSVLRKVENRQCTPGCRSSLEPSALI